ncbi:MAG: hypothetical protein ACFFD3_16690, partial [Candidatus Thorarchaeota archaeon]
TPDSFNNFGALVADAWEYWGTLDFYIGLQGGINSSAVAFPTGFLDGALYFGQVMPDDVVTIQYSVWDAYGTTLLDYTADSLSGSSYYYIEDATYSFTGTTFSYNDTVVYDWPDSQMYGYFNLKDELGEATYNSAMSTYDYVTMVVAFDGDDVAGAEPWMFLYEWFDNDPHDGMPNLYNLTTNTGNELRRLTSASNAANVNEMSYANTAGLGSLTGNMTLVIHDPIHDVNMTAPGNDFTATVIFWSTAAGPVTWADNGVASGYSANATLTVPSGAETGIHTGVATVSHGGDSLKIPYSFTVVANLTGAAGAKHTIVDGWGAELSPYDNAAWGCMEEDPDAWDFRSYAIYNQHATAAYLGIRVVWEDMGNDMFVQVYDSTLGGLGAGSAGTDYTTAVIAEIDGAGMYYLEIHPIALNASVSGPVNFTIEAMWYEDLTDQPAVISYTSDDRAGVTPVDDGDTLWGDHVVINASYPAFNLPNMPEYEVTYAQIGFLSGVFHQGSGPLVIPDGSYDPFSGTVDLTQFAWDYVDGIVEGDTVDITVDFSNGDCDIMVWWADIDNTTWTYGNNLVEDSMATGAHPEVGSFVAARSGRLAIGIFDYDLSAGTWYTTVDTRVGIYAHDHSNEVTYDTYNIGRNGTFMFQIVAETETNIGFEVNLASLTFQNFFSPVLTDIEVTGTGAAKTITWDFTDLNAQDGHSSEVLLSADGGETYQLIATELEGTSYIWDSTGFTIRNYMVMVRVYDNSTFALSDSIESTEFNAGTVTPPTSTTTPPPTTTTTTPPPGIDPLWIGLIGGIGVGVVVILILFLVKKK